MEKFTQDLKDVLHQASIERKKLGYPYLDTGILFLGILKKHQGIKQYMQDNFNVTYAKVKEIIVSTIGEGNDKTNKEPNWNIYTPVTRNVLGMDCSEECNIDTFAVLKNLFLATDGVFVRLISRILEPDYDTARKQILADISSNKIEGCYNLKDVDLRKNISFSYYYDLITSDEKHQKMVHFRKIPILQVDKKLYNLISSRSYTLNATMSLDLHLRASVFNTNQTNQIDSVLFANKKSGEVFVTFFDYKDGLLISKYNSKILPEDIEEVLDCVTDKYYTITEDDIMSISDNELPMMDIEELYFEQVKEKERKAKKDQNQNRNRETSNALKKMSCLSNVNERVKTHQTNVIGMDKEMEQLIKGLMKIRKPNVILKGEPGVGKTALVEKLAILINENKVPYILQDKIIYELSMSGAVAGTRYRGEFEEKINKIIEETEKNPNIILFIDEIHTMVGAGGAEGAIDASNIFKPALARGEIKVIGATTNDEYDKYIKQDGALSRRFQTIEILEPLENQVKDIMRGLKSKLEKSYNVTISEKLIDEIYNKAKMRKGMFPDIALDELEDWCVQQNYMDYIDNCDIQEEKQISIPKRKITKKEKVN